MAWVWMVAATLPGTASGRGCHQAGRARATDRRTSSFTASPSRAAGLGPFTSRTFSHEPLTLTVRAREPKYPRRKSAYLWSTYSAAVPGRRHRGNGGRPQMGSARGFTAPLRRAPILILAPVRSGGITVDLRDYFPGCGVPAVSDHLVGPTAARRGRTRLLSPCPAEAG